MTGVRDPSAVFAGALHALALQARGSLPQLRVAPALADAVADWADGLTAVSDALGRDLVPVAGLQRLARAHRALIDELITTKGGASTVSARGLTGMRAPPPR